MTSRERRLSIDDRKANLSRKHELLLAKISRAKNLDVNITSDIKFSHILNTALRAARKISTCTLTQQANLTEIIVRLFTTEDDLLLRLQSVQSTSQHHPQLQKHDLDLSCIIGDPHGLLSKPQSTASALLDQLTITRVYYTSLHRIDQEQLNDALDWIADIRDSTQPGWQTTSKYDWPGLNSDIASLIIHLAEPGAHDTAWWQNKMRHLNALLHDGQCLRQIAAVFGDSSLFMLADRPCKTLLQSTSDKCLGAALQAVVKKYSVLRHIFQPVQYALDELPGLKNWSFDKGTMTFAEFLRMPTRRPSSEQLM